jgi:exonuclease 3'-5' domain-containing protein 1
VESVSTLTSLLDDFAALPIQPPSLYLDLEGIRLRRQGSISIISIYVAPTKKVYLVDIYRLGKDLQLMELATRQGPKDFVTGLAKCIQKDSVVSTSVKAEWQRTKDGASRLYNPKKGRRYEIFNARPLHPNILQYYAGDVALLPGPYQAYNNLCLLAPP